MINGKMSAVCLKNYTCTPDVCQFYFYNIAKIKLLLQAASVANRTVMAEGKLQMSTIRWATI
jgi:hypothetical protein